MPCVISSGMCRVSLTQLTKDSLAQHFAWDATTRKLYECHDAKNCVQIECVVSTHLPFDATRVNAHQIEYTNRIIRYAELTHKQSGIGLIEFELLTPMCNPHSPTKSKR